MTLLLSSLRTLNEILTAGIAITALSLLGYALTFNLRDRVARSFALILLCVTFVFAGEALSSVETNPRLQEFWLQLQWPGLLFLPPAYLHFSDALLATTGRPSKGRRRILVRLTYLVSLAFLALLPFGLLVGPLQQQEPGIIYLSRTTASWFFTAFYFIFVTWSWVNLWRAYNRAVTRTSRRRMGYLLAGSIAPGIGSFPFMLFSAPLASLQPLVFWLIAIANEFFVFYLLILMAYTVAFFGVSWPDRVVKRRLAKWLMRGPVTASVVLGVTTLIRRTGDFFGMPDTVAIPIIMVVLILAIEHGITMLSPIWERVFFTGGDQENLRLVQNLEERMLTTDDFRQFIEGVLAAVCDQVQTRTAFLAVAGPVGIEMIVPVSDDRGWSERDLSENILQLEEIEGDGQGPYLWGEYWLVPLFDTEEPPELVGVMGIWRGERTAMTEEQQEAVFLLGDRAALALIDLRSQRQVFASLKSLNPQVELVQRLRAISRYDAEGMMAAADDLPESVDLSGSVKDALSHFWGGPKLANSPLLRLKIVQDALEEHEGNTVKALRAILRQAIERVRPEGERRFTAEWILYNILDLKFLEGRKVREVAMRLAVSEADLYRKQRIAVEAVSQAIIEMERQAVEQDGMQEEKVNV